MGTEGKLVRHKLSPTDIEMAARRVHYLPMVSLQTNKRHGVDVGQQGIVVLREITKCSVLL